MKRTFFNSDVCFGQLTARTWLPIGAGPMGVGLHAAMVMVFRDSDETGEPTDLTGDSVSLSIDIIPEEERTDLELGDCARLFSMTFSLTCDEAEQLAGALMRVANANPDPVQLPSLAKIELTRRLEQSFSDPNVREKYQQQLAVDLSNERTFVRAVFDVLDDTKPLQIEECVRQRRTTCESDWEDKNRFRRVVGFPDFKVHRVMTSPNTLVIEEPDGDQRVVKVVSHTVKKIPRRAAS